MSAMPITLKGDNLGERHRHFNSLVCGARQQGTCLSTVLDSPVASRLDTLFKIELASKQRNVDYILKSLQHDDMLFVSRALNCCTWLLEPQYQDVINPEHLEGEVFPHMTTTAVGKMKQWLHIHLRDAQRCRQFYQFYSCCDSNIRFLRHCTPDFIADEFLNIIHRVTPKQLKVICRHCPRAIKLYYDNFSKNAKTFSALLKNEKQYFECTRYLLHSDPDTYFEILEKYYFYERLGSLSAAVTEHIVKRHKQRVLEQPELYAAWLLHSTTLAKHLSVNENKDIVMRLARAEYLAYQFSYKFVEPFIKRLRVDERAAFKKKVFVDKDVGDKVKDCPYREFSRPELADTGTVFDDRKHEPEEYRFFERTKFPRCFKKRKYQRHVQSAMYSGCSNMEMLRMRTPLDELFDRYRFFNFERTLFELRKKLAAESSVRIREFMMLVLVSKCGENMEDVEKLVRFLADRHRNESSNLRAAVVRSLAVRACAWRLSSDAWSSLLHFGRDLGLDGASPSICKEGLHAVVLRTLLSGEECPPVLREAFMVNFSLLTEYKLNGTEKNLVGQRLPALLVQSACASTSSALHRLQLLLDVLSSLNKKATECPGAVRALTVAVQNHPFDAKYLLQRMYEARIARRELFREYFALLQTNESYMNVLRHDTTLLKSTKEFEDTLKGRSSNYDGFLRKLALYFAEDDGLAATYIAAIERAMGVEPHAGLARPLALLRPDLRPIISEYMKEPKGSVKRRLASALHDNYHLSGIVDLEASAWPALGAKAIANRLATCKAVDVDKYIAKSLEWRRTFKVAVLLAERHGRTAEVYKIVAGARPGAALRCALLYLKKNKSDDSKAGVWRAVSPALAALDLAVEQRRFLLRALENADSVPADVQAEYWVAVFAALQRVSQKKAMPVLCRLENMLSEVDVDIIKKVIDDFLEEFTMKTSPDDDDYAMRCNCMKVRIVSKYLLLGEGEERRARLETVWVPFRDRLAALVRRNTGGAAQYLEELVISLKYNSAFFNPRLSCSLVLERIAADLRALLPMEGYFKTFVYLHATMSYYKAIKYCVARFPEKFDDVRWRRVEGAAAVGEHYGNYVGKEVTELASRYFDSITILYERNLETFLEEEFPYNESRNTFKSAFIRGVLAAGGTEALLLVDHVMNPEIMEFENILKASQNEEVTFFLHTF